MSDGPRMPGVPEAQQNPVLKRYPLRRWRIPVGARVVSMVLPDDRAWLRRGAWADDVVRGEEPPYWIRVWPAAIALARQLARSRDLVGKRVLDLGCGVGVPGIQAAAGGARVCFVDRESDALAFASWNARSQPGCVHEPTVQQVDWASATVTGTYDLVLLSDVSYHRSHHAPVQRQLASVLDARGCLLHCDPMRELSTQFLAELGRSYQLATWYRMTSVAERRVNTRIVMASRTAESLAAWGRLLGQPGPHGADSAGLCRA